MPMLSFSFGLFDSAGARSLQKPVADGSHIFSLRAFDCQGKVATGLALTIENQPDAFEFFVDKIPGLDRTEIDEVILGCGQPHGPAGHNVARVAALRAGLPATTAGLTVNRYCNSGLQAIVQAVHMIEREGAAVVIGGGVESITMMSRDNAPNPWLQERLPSLYMPMGETAEPPRRGEAYTASCVTSVSVAALRCAALQ